MIIPGTNCLQLNFLETDWKWNVACRRSNVLKKEHCEEVKKVGLDTGRSLSVWDCKWASAGFTMSSKAGMAFQCCPKMKQGGHAYRYLQKPSTGSRLCFERSCNLGWDGYLLLRTLPREESSFEPLAVIIPMSWASMHQPWRGDLGRLFSTYILFYLRYNHVQPRVSILIPFPDSRRTVISMNYRKRKPLPVVKWTGEWQRQQDQEGKVGRSLWVSRKW